MATVLALVMWSSNAVGVQGTNVAQTNQAVEAGAPGDYGNLPTVDPSSSEAPAAGAPTEVAAPPPVEAPPAAISTIRLVAKTVPKMGDVVQDGDGRTLYRFDKDTPKPPKSNCEGSPCAETWPALLSKGIPQLEGVDPAIVGTVPRADGSEQVTIAGWPVYTYSKDLAPGQWKGQGVGGTWFVIQPDGKRNVECLPAGVTVPPATG
jgi:predicted lipoprotein with Yx(FWY)xxD motif